MVQSEITIVVVICWIIAFALMSYKWTYIFPTVTLVSLIGMHYVVDTYYYVFLFLTIMSMFMAIFTLPYGTPNISNYGSLDSSGYYGGDCDIDGGGCE
jgi:hypothetical protein